MSRFAGFARGPIDDAFLHTDFKKKHEETLSISQKTETHSSCESMVEDDIVLLQGLSTADPCCLMRCTWS